MRILVTGRDGQVAQSLAGDSRGHELVFAARPELDLARPETIRPLVERIRPDAIVSAAAYTAVDKAEEERELAMTVNGAAPGMLADAAAAVGAPILHLSTDYVFDGQGERAWREDDAVAPINAYGATKLAGEQAIAAAGADFAILRTAWVYSPFGHNFAKTMLRLAETRDSLNVVEDQVGCPTSALDIADAIHAVLGAWQRGEGGVGIFHFAGTGEASWAEFAREIFAGSAARGGPSATVNGIPTSAYPTPAARPANSRLDCSRFADSFGHRAPPWQQSLQRVLDQLIGPKS